MLNIKISIGSLTKVIQVYRLFKLDFTFRIHDTYQDFPIIMMLPRLLTILKRIQQNKKDKSFLNRTSAGTQLHLQNTFSISTRISAELHMHVYVLSFKVHGLLKKRKRISLICL